MDAVFEMSKTFNLNFVVDAVGQLPLIGGFAINSFKTDVFDVFTENLNKT
jgi:hypothetical protein